MFISYQDFQSSVNKASFIRTLIDWHNTTILAATARDADSYDRQQNSTITKYNKFYYNILGKKMQDKISANNKIASNFFRRLNTQRCAYSLGNGISFTNEGVKEQLGASFDTELYRAGYKALIHGMSFIFLNVDHIHVFPVTQFAPLWDEDTGLLMAGVRFWNLDIDKPEMAVLYEVDGYTTYKADKRGGVFYPTSDKRPYRYTVQRSGLNDEPEVIAAENYSALPVVPLYGNEFHQSTLVGMKEAIDSYDMICSGFANDLEDCAENYWLISNAMGSDENDMAMFRQRLKTERVAAVEEGQVQLVSENLPYAARQAYLDSIRSNIYENFGGLDVHTVAAGATNDHIDAAYQALDENADDFEYQIIQAVQALLKLIGIDDTPIFKRNRLSNTKEQVDIIMEAAQYLDEETILGKLPFLSPDEVQGILDRKAGEDMSRFSMTLDEEKEEAFEDAEEEITNGD